MHIPLTEPVSPRYIHINPATNKVHLMVPVVGGQEISTDNTCKIKAALKEFFDGGALRELNAYKEALVFDIGLLKIGQLDWTAKDERLAQIGVYIKMVLVMREFYDKVMMTFLKRPSNLYSIQLRPRDQDSQSRVVNPAFNVNRGNDTSGTPLSPLYNAMHSTFFKTAVAAADPPTRLTMAIPAAESFADIQRALGEQSLTLFGLTIDFTQLADGTVATKEAIDEIMGIGVDVTREDYIEALFGSCALNINVTLPTAPFYSISEATHADEKTERLSILTQFFLANLNVYCKAKGMSCNNFGVILDASSELSSELVSVVSTALTSSDDVEKAICNFFNVNAHLFGLSRALTLDDLTIIRQVFERTYRTVTAGENSHMDDFMILDKEATGKMAKFVIHQGSICVNFAELINPVIGSNELVYFASILADFETHSAEISHRNECVAADDVVIDVETLTARINEEQFKHLPSVVKEACLKYPGFFERLFLHCVAKGLQSEAEVLLTTKPAYTQILLRTPGIFTDYSGRTFNCTAYEYAYWAKDTHMCRMLEQQMDDESKNAMAVRIDEIERINQATEKPVGLRYQQNGIEHCSAHFDFTSLKTAYQHYHANYYKWEAEGDFVARKEAWQDISKAQSDVPAHVAQEYCRPDRSFEPTPEFNEAILPRVLIINNWKTDCVDSWYSLTTSCSDLVLIRCGMVGGERGDVVAAFSGWLMLQDWEAIIRLDDVRTADLTQSREHLNPSVLSYGMRV